MCSCCSSGLHDSLYSSAPSGFCCVPEQNKLPVQPMSRPAPCPENVARAKKGKCFQQGLENSFWDENLYSGLLICCCSLKHKNTKNVSAVIGWFGSFPVTMISPETIWMQYGTMQSGIIRFPELPAMSHVGSQAKRFVWWSSYIRSSGRALILFVIACGIVSTQVKVEWSAFSVCNWPWFVGEGFYSQLWTVPDLACWIGRMFILL